MITIVQVVIIALALIVITMTLSNRSTHSGKAWKKIALVLLAITMIVAVLFPDLTNKLANLVGVGRGCRPAAVHNSSGFYFVCAKQLSAPARPEGCSLSNGAEDCPNGSR